MISWKFAGFGQAQRMSWEIKERQSQAFGCPQGSREEGCLGYNPEDAVHMLSVALPWVGRAVVSGCNSWGVQHVLSFIFILCY